MYNPAAPESIQSMFATIAEGYDKANNTFSLGLHKKWNRTLIRSMPPVDRLLDLCAGTGEIAFGYLHKHPKARAVLLDFCPEMLEVAKIKAQTLSSRCTFVEGDAQQLPFENASVDAVTISYGIRNVQEPQKCFEEVARVLRPGGQFGILELTRPTSPLLRALFSLYSKNLLPLLGKWRAKNYEAYRYLSSSIETFTPPDELEKQLEEAGLTPLKRKKLGGGVATLFLSKK